ncbi:hypothetical protein QR680_003242 [Steinernema hermaphroditum]|uniref:guanylate cyclase n=1 Tax=Steinernema hermaphroditum TaxID=289476 RepID=A0AA39LJQ2_9BILA|nr:hypothetical protein QR680_003242 [Steinernema hermaphroditum]
MFGWIHESFRQLVHRKYGKATWLKILEVAKFEEGTESEINHYYSDDETMKIVNAMANIIGIPVEEVWEAYGGFLIQFTMETGWDELLRAMAPDLQGFLDGLDALHYFIDHVVYRTKLKGPSFRCEAQTDGSLVLHYYSKRSGLYPIVKGVVREVARRIYDTEVIMKVTERRQEHLETFVTEHVVFLISQVIQGTDSQNSTTKAITTKAASHTQLPGLNSCILSLRDFCAAFPHHICFDRNLIIEHVGDHIREVSPQIINGETALCDIVEMTHPEIPLTWESISSFENSLFVFKMHSSAHAQSLKPVMLKGQMVQINNGQFVLYMCSLNVTTVEEMIETTLFISDMQRHDGTRDLVMLNQSRMSQVELNRRLEDTTRILKKMAVELEAEKQKVDELLCELMPLSVAESLRQSGSVEACEFPEATLLFTDIVTFTNICAMCTPYDVVNLLNDLYLRFDGLVGMHDVYKVETIGDAYMIVGGVPKECENHAERVMDVSIGMLMESKLVKSPITKQPIQIRIGIHSGAVVAGVVGIKMPRYCLFGETVNLANKMEQSGVPSRIHVSMPAKTIAHRTNNSFQFSDRGNTLIKGKGTMFTFFLEKNDRKSVWELCGRQRSEHHSIDGYAELHERPAGAVIETANHTQENGVSNKETKRTCSPICSIS